MPRRREKSSSAWLAQSNDKTLAFAMIETREALAALDGILEVDGIDGVLVGPSDFSIAWTEGREMNPALDDMMEAIASIAVGLRPPASMPAIYVVDPGLTGRYVEMGFRLFALGSDVKYLALGPPVSWTPPENRSPRGNPHLIRIPIAIHGRRESGFDDVDQVKRVAAKDKS